MLGLFSRPLEKALNPTKLVRVHGVVFRIKKLDPFSYMNGSQSVQALYQTYETKNQVGEANLDRVRAHYRDVLMEGVVEPKLVRKADEAEAAGGTFVDHLFTDWSLATELYAEIMAFTYGKKKRSLF